MDETCAPARASTRSHSATHLHWGRRTERVCPIPSGDWKRLSHRGGQRSGRQARGRRGGRESKLNLQQVPLSAAAVRRQVTHCAAARPAVVIPLGVTGAPSLSRIRYAGVTLRVLPNSPLKDQERRLRRRGDSRTGYFPRQPARSGSACCAWPSAVLARAVPAGGGGSITLAPRHRS
jgi:hypothetical protein